jgi:low temperature requirement protein LtrA
LNARQVVTLIAVAVTLGLLGVFWLVGGVIPWFRTEDALAVGLPIIIAIAILAPAFRSRLK